MDGGGVGGWREEDNKKWSGDICMECRYLINVNNGLLVLGAVSSSLVSSTSWRLTARCGWLVQQHLYWDGVGDG